MFTFMIKYQCIFILKGVKNFVARNGSKKTIFWLIVVLIIVCWIELVMVVKFFTKEYVRYTMEKDNNPGMTYYE